KYRELQLNRLRSFRALFWAVLLSGPILILIMQKASWIKPMSLNQTGEGVVAMVEADGSYGSAFNVGPRLWITALHVVEDIEEGSLVDLQYNQAKKPETLSAKVKYHSTNENLDFSLLETDAASNINQVFFGLGDFNNVQLGDEVIIIGYPAGLYSYAK